MAYDFMAAAHSGPLRAASTAEGTAIREALLRIPSPKLSMIGDADVKSRIDAAIAADGGILLVGLAPGDVEVEKDRFRAIAHVRLTNGTRMDIQFGGVMDGRGNAEPSRATLVA